MCKRFLWTGKAELTRKSLVAWSRLCHPQSAGGLNFIDIFLWNKSDVCKLLWNMCMKKDKLWAKWIHAYYGKGRSVWEIEPKQASWVVQKIFKAKKKYFDEAGFSRIELQVVQQPSIKSIYQRLQGQFDKVSWKGIICGKQGSPKWIFILRLAALERLYTCDRLIKWGMDNIDEQCQLCRGAPKTLNHVFFTCPFSGSIWLRLLQWLHINGTNMGWDDELKLAETWCKGRSSRAKVYEIVLAATVYYVWK
ncbi:uncharacterized protein LOC132624271 [Lycium barbarum]|uniref:uncharacterized protein LOC132624271 n=1 Tax=Lycium barbarum TaxID=112863 RepID=UPI00293F120A|nr:uncharacterized protein LOC132624271 [Lycium barbarum]